MIKSLGFVPQGSRSLESRWHFGLETVFVRMLLLFVSFSLGNSGPRTKWIFLNGVVVNEYNVAVYYRSSR